LGGRSRRYFAGISRWFCGSAKQRQMHRMQLQIEAATW
jgi:hypothetical protein